ncbi:MAG TPA: ABC transporter permease [Solirubrobacteraceae bacterium]|jgi:ribose/xylose/arabinose/galactoside ABC-type transport system permease subunit
MKLAGPLRAAIRRVSAPYAILILMVAVLAVLPAVSHYSVTATNVYDVLQNFASLGLVALALGTTMIAGEFDLSVTSMYLLGAMVAVLTGAPSPVAGVLLALAVALGVGLIQGGVIAGLRLNSMPVTLGGYLILLGTTYILGHNQTVTYANYSVGLRLDQPILSIFSIRSFVSIGIFAVAALVMAYTRVGRDIHAIGGDRRASRIAGVRVARVVIGVFVASALMTALAGALLGYSLSTASPTIAVNQLTFAATAALLGGVSLAGGRGSPLGIAAGVLTLSIIQELLGILGAASYVQSLVTGGVLVAVASVQGLPAALARMRSLTAWRRPAAPPSSTAADA